MGKDSGSKGFLSGLSSMLMEVPDWDDGPAPVQMKATAYGKGSS